MRWVLLVAVGTALIPGGARAHGGRPQLQTVVRQGGTLVVPGTFGLLRSLDGGATWSSLCHEVMPDARPGSLTPVLLLPTGTLLVGGVFGAVRGERVGCGWTYVPPTSELASVVDFATLADGTQVALRVSAIAPMGLHRIVADAASLEPLGAPFPLGDYAERVRVDGDRIVVSGIRYRPASSDADGWLAVSRDRGMTWARVLVPFESGERHLFVVGPAARGVYATVLGDDHDRLLSIAVDDPSPPLDLVERLVAPPPVRDRPFAFAVTASGEAYYGNSLAGLRVRRSDGHIEILDRALGVSCAVVDGATLWLCTDGYPDSAGDGFALARQRLGMPYAPEPVLRYRDVDGPASCGLPSDSVCAGFYSDLELDWGLRMPDAGLRPDAARPDAGTVAGPVDAAVLDAGLDARVALSFDASPRRRDAGVSETPEACGCTAPGSSRTSSRWFVVVLSALGGLRMGRGASSARPRRRRSDSSATASRR